MRHKKPARKKARRRPQKPKRQRSNRDTGVVLEFRHSGLKGRFQIDLPAGWKQCRLPVPEPEQDA